MFTLRASLVAGLLGVAMRSIGCSCIDFGLASHFAGADYVFEGFVWSSRIVAWSDPEEPFIREITLAVGHVYKGVLTTDRVVIRTSTHGQACGTLLPVGTRQLVFAREIEKFSTGPEPDRRYVHSSLCSGNRFYPFWCFSLRKNIRRLSRGEEIPAGSKWAIDRAW